MNVIECPICDAEIILEDEVPGDTIYCSYCSMPLKLVRDENDKLVAKEIDEF